VTGIPLVRLRAGELVDDVVVAAGRASAPLAERAVVRVLRARGRRWGDSVVHPPVAVIYLSPELHRRLGPALEAGREAMERRIAERLDPDEVPAGVRVHVRAHPGVRHLRVAAPRVRNLVPVHRRPVDHTRLEPTRLAETGLALLGGPGGTPIPVPPQGLVLGRGDCGGDPRVSREHVRLQPVGPELLRCLDLGSRNGTWIDGRRIAPSAELRPGQLLRIGSTELRIIRLDGGHR
jgi:hypothetical protein